MNKAEVSESEVRDVPSKNRQQPGMLRQRLTELAACERARFHMPGHKGRGTFEPEISLDFTEVPGSDNLHAPGEIIRDVQDKLAHIYGARSSFMLTGGTTAGIIAAMMCLCPKGSSLLVPANAHRSVYAGLAFGGIKPVFYRPLETEGGAVVTGELAGRLLDEHPEVRGILVVSPDYSGCLSELEEIARAAHERGRRMITDEAHGAHLRFAGIPDACACGSDFTVQSTHKTLSALTQSSLMHLADPADQTRMQKLLAMIESSSPSYLQMMSIEEAADEAVECGAEVFGNIADRRAEYAAAQTGGEAFYLVDPAERFDSSKWLFRTADGYRDEKILRDRFGIVPEAVYPTEILMMTGIRTTAEDLDLLCEAAEYLNEIHAGEKPASGQKERPMPEDRSTGAENANRQKHGDELFELGLDPGEAVRAASEFVPLTGALDRISAGFVIPYPPGIPVLIPGARIGADQISAILDRIESGEQPQGIRESSDGPAVEAVAAEQP